MHDTGGRHKAKAGLTIKGRVQEQKPGRQARQSSQNSESRQTSGPQNKQT